MNYGYGEALVEMLPALEQTGSRLRIWGPPPGQECRALAESANVRLEGFLPSPEVWEPVKRECDAVILPYSSSKRMKELYSYHFPSKLPEYLALGMPVIITGPEYATGMRWGKCNRQAAVTASSSRIEELEPILQRLSTEGDVRVKLAQGAVEAAKKEFDPMRIRKTFRELLRHRIRLN